jgi:hypothetical protein
MSEYYEVEVTFTKTYLIPINMNGWEIEKIIDDWFINYPLGSHHATRDGCCIGNSGKYISHSLKDVLISPDDF